MNNTSLAQDRLEDEDVSPEGVDDPKSQSLCLSLPTLSSVKAPSLQAESIDFFILGWHHQCRRTWTGRA